jgi:hypothetical protein
LCEMVADLGESMNASVVDAQMATALLTGIVAETDRFSNEKTTPRTMTLSAILLADGANQQLVASQLEGVEPTEEPLPEPTPVPEPIPAPVNTELPQPVDAVTALQIDHEEDEEQSPVATLPSTVIQIDEQGVLKTARDLLEQQENEEKAQQMPPEAPPSAPTPEITQEAPVPIPEYKAAEETSEPETEVSADSRHVIDTLPPTDAPSLTANTKPEPLGPNFDPLAAPASDAPLMNHEEDSSSEEKDKLTLEALEESVESPHVQNESGGMDTNTAPELPHPLDMPTPSFAPTEIPSESPEPTIGGHTYLAPPTVPPPMMPTLPSQNDRNDPNNPNNVAL